MHVACYIDPYTNVYMHHVLRMLQLPIGLLIWLALHIIIIIIFIALFIRYNSYNS